MSNKPTCCEICGVRKGSAGRGYEIRLIHVPTVFSKKGCQWVCQWCGLRNGPSSLGKEPRLRCLTQDVYIQVLKELGISKELEWREWKRGYMQANTVYGFIIYINDSTLTNSGNFLVTLGPPSRARLPAFQWRAECSSAEDAVIQASEFHQLLILEFLRQA